MDLLYGSLIPRLSPAWLGKGAISHASSSERQVRDRFQSNTPCFVRKRDDTIQQACKQSNTKVESSSEVGRDKPAFLVRVECNVLG